MSDVNLVVNGKPHKIDVAPETPLLWVLRDTLGLTGTKFGCGMGLCGACTVHLDGEAVRSCQTPVGSVGSKKITTIEGLTPDRSHPVQRAWIAEQVPQCGYCHSRSSFSMCSLGVLVPCFRFQRSDCLRVKTCRSQRQRNNEDSRFDHR